MKVDLSQKIKDFDGVVVKQIEEQPDGSKVTKDVDLALACVRALSTPLEEDRNMEPDKVVERWQLCMRLNAGGEQELSVEEAALIRKRMPKTWTVAVAGPAISMLSG